MPKKLDAATRTARPPAPRSGLKAAKLPAFGKVAPQLATLVDDVPTQGDWVYEVKYDSYRAIATLDGGQSTIASRNGKDWTEHFATHPSFEGLREDKRPDKVVREKEAPLGRATASKK